MHTLIVDGNWLMENQFAVFRRSELIANVPFGAYGEKFFSGMHQTFISNLRKLNIAVDRVIVTADGSRSWRKDYAHTAPKSPYALPDIAMPEHSGYKGERSKDSDIDWQGLYSNYENWLNALKSYGITILKVKNAEADDCMQIAADTLFDKGISSLIMSSDKDMTQVVKHNEEAHVSFYKRTGKKINGRMSTYYELVTSCDGLVNQVGFLDVPKFALHNVQVFTQLNEVVQERTIEEPHTFMMYKTFLGDEGDGVQEIVYKFSGKLTKNGALAKRHTSAKMIHKALLQYVGENYGSVINETHLYNKPLMLNIAQSIYMDLYKTSEISPEVTTYLSARIDDNLSLMHLHTVAKRPIDIINNVHDAMPDEIAQYSAEVFNTKEVLTKANIIAPADDFMTMFT